MGIPSRERTPHTKASASFPLSVPPSLSILAPWRVTPLQPLFAFCFPTSFSCFYFQQETSPACKLAGEWRAKLFKANSWSWRPHHSPSATVGRSERSGWDFPEHFPQPAGFHINCKAQLFHGPFLLEFFQGEWGHSELSNLVCHWEDTDLTSTRHSYLQTQRIVN